MKSNEQDDARALLRIGRQMKLAIPYVVLIFTAGVGWAGVAAQSTRIDKLERQYDDMAQTVIQIKVDTAEIKQSLKYVEGALGIKKAASFP